MTISMPELFAPLQQAAPRPVDKSLLELTRKRVGLGARAVLIVLAVVMGGAAIFALSTWSLAAFLCPVIPAGGLFGMVALYLSQDMWSAKRLLRDGELCVGRVVPDDASDVAASVALTVASVAASVVVGVDRPVRRRHVHGNAATPARTNIVYSVGGVDHQLRFQSTFVGMLDPDQIYILALPDDPFRAALVLPEHGLVAPK